jgi:histidinol phosphatase-like enzyme
MLEHDQSARCDYLKNKIFLTFDYSYYQNIPKTASMYVGKRINNLNALITQEEVLAADKIREGSISNIENTKWRK